jgi:hypothetical protein
MLRPGRIPPEEHDTYGSLEEEKQHQQEENIKTICSVTREDIGRRREHEQGDRGGKQEVLAYRGCRQQREPLAQTRNQRRRRR